MSNTGKIRYHISDPNSTPADGIFSFKNQTNLTFNIAEDENRFLIGSSVKICFKLVLREGTALVTSAGDCHLSAGIGVHGLFNQIDVHSYETNTALSSSRVYNRLCSGLLSNGVCDENDVVQSQSHAGLGISMDYMTSNVGVYSGATDSEAYQSYCIRPMVGSIMANDFYLGSVVANGIGGVKLNLTLQPSSNAITSDSAPSGSDTYEYEISEVKILYSTREASPDERRAKRMKDSWENSYAEMVRTNENRGVSRDELEQNWARVVASAEGQESVYNYKDFNGYLNTIASDNHSLSLNLGLRKCNGVFINFAPSSFINSTTVDEDGNRQYPLKDSANDQIPFKSITFQKGSELWPNRFVQNNNVDENYTDARLDYTVDRQAETKKCLLDSIVEYPMNDYQRGAVYNSLYDGQASVDVETDKLVGVFGVGSQKTSVVGGSSDYMFSSLGANISSENLGTFANNTAYIFAHYDSQISIDNNMINVSN